MEVKYTGNYAVDKLYGVDFTGDIVPTVWYSRILTDAGKPDVIAISLLSEIMYWYRPAEIRDESSIGEVILKKKFKSDILQLNYEQIRSKFGFSKNQARDALSRLEKAGLIERECRTVDTTRSKLGNVMFIRLDSDKLLDLTFGDNGPCRKKPTRDSELSEEVIGKISQACKENPMTYTENTTEIPTEDYLTVYRSAVSDVKDQISYDSLVADRRIDKGSIDEIAGLIAEICCSEGGVENINGNPVRIELIRERFGKISRDVVEAVLDNLQAYPRQISNVRGYLLTALYNSASACETDLDLRVRHDMYGRECSAWGA